MTVRDEVSGTFKMQVYFVFGEGREFQIRLHNENTNGEYRVQKMGTTLFSGWKNLYTLNADEVAALKSETGIKFRVALVGAYAVAYVGDVAVGQVDLSSGIAANATAQIAVVLYGNKDVENIKIPYELEKGKYSFYLGNSVRNTQKLAYVYTAAEDTVVQQLTAKLVPYQLKHRMLSDGTYEDLPLRQQEKAEPVLEPIPEKELETVLPGQRAVGPMLPRTPERNYFFFDEVAEGKATLDAFVAQLTDAQLVSMMGGQPNTGVANTYGIGNIPEYGVPNAMTSDGPAGVRIKSQCGVYTTAFPCVTQVACTWDPELAYAIGVAGAKELKENNLAIWLTPAVNIHRNPMCGRNFEYYSEDPLLTGVMAAGTVKGIQSQKVSSCLKHLALNNKETNRRNCDSRVSERAAREIYLKPFEIVVKNADPWYVMSAYNPANGHRTSENRELLEDILRGEWGFGGMVSTDWNTYSEQYVEINAGNDFRMPTGFPERLKEAMARGLISRQQIEISAKRILGLLLKLE